MYFHWPSFEQYFNADFKDQRKMNRLKKAKTGCYSLRLFDHSILGTYYLMLLNQKYNSTKSLEQKYNSHVGFGFQESYATRIY